MKSGLGLYTPLFYWDEQILIAWIGFHALSSRCPEDFFPGDSCTTAVLRYRSSVYIAHGSYLPFMEYLVTVMQCLCDGGQVRIGDHSLGFPLHPLLSGVVSQIAHRIPATPTVSHKQTAHIIEKYVVIKAR